MRLFHQAVSFAVVVCVMVSAVSFGKAHEIDFQGRTLPFEITQDSILSGTLESRTISDSAELKVRPELDDAAVKQVYGLLVPGTQETTVTVNGHRLFLTPAHRHDAAVYYLDSRRLTAGENVIQIERTSIDSWAGTVMFSVQDGYESAHFARIFSEPVEGSGGLQTRETPPSSSQDNYDVLWYDSTWIPRISGTYLESGSQVIIGVKALANISFIDVDFDIGGYSGYTGSMQIDAVDSGVGTSALTYSNLANRDAPRVRITLPKSMAVDEEFQVRIAYHGAPNTDFPKEIFGRNAFNRKTTNDGGIMIYSENQPYGARRWWPCKDHPSDKATTSVQRIRVAKNSGYNLTAVSNGTLEETNDLGSTTEYVWVNHYPIATYLVNLCVGNYIYKGTNYTSRDGQTQMPIGAYILPEDESFEGNGYLGTLQVMNFLADTFGEYPFLEEKYVTVAWGDTFAIEHQTCTSMPAGADNGLADGLTRRNVHEMVHQWFGDKITMHSWDQLWLNEGFATYGEALWEEHAFGFQAFRNYVRGFNYGGGPVVSPAADGFNDGNFYKRPARVLDMLRFYLGDEVFFQALKDYAATGYTTAVSQPGDDPEAGVVFQTAVEQSAGMAPGALQQFFDQWLYSEWAGDNYETSPRYSYSLAYDVETSSVAIQLKQTQGKQSFVMPVPFRLTASDSSTTDIVMPPGASSHSFNLGTFRPVSYEIDPDDWLVRRNGLRINTLDLLPASAGAYYFAGLSFENNSNSASWSKLSGTPSWLSVSSAGLLSGTPPSAGLYPVNLRLTNSVGDIIDVTYKLVVRIGGSEEDASDIVINEISYQSRGGNETGEFVELYNRTDEAVDIGGWKVVLVGPPSQSSDEITLPPGATIPANGYYVIGNASAFAGVYPGVINLDLAWDDPLSDFGPAGVVLETNSGMRVDSVAYQSDNNYGSGSDWTNLLAEGGTGKIVSWNLNTPQYNATLGRLPNGKDSDNNLQDFSGMAPSPGAANAGVTLPFFDDFNNGARAEWRPGFTAPLKVITPGTAEKPTVAAPSPAGGQVLEVFDPTGGGDVNYLPGAFDKLNFEGYIWIPQWQGSDKPWSTGVGINTRVESSWFGNSTGYALPNGFYLEYQNGSGVDLMGNHIPNSAGQARLFAADSSSVPGVGLNAISITTLGDPVNPTRSSWQPFRLVYDRPADRLYAKLGDDVIYDGAIPAGNFNESGGASVGFRENHSGNLDYSHREGTWVDNITLSADTTISARVEDYNLY